jgi:hypothetical protein
MRRTQAAPIPTAPPVTNATLPFNLPMAMPPQGIDA